jgi:hypothetical protein
MSGSFRKVNFLQSSKFCRFCRQCNLQFLSLEGHLFIHCVYFNLSNTCRYIAEHIALLRLLANSISQTLSTKTNCLISHLFHSPLQF